jgi:hypothetical protein
LVGNNRLTIFVQCIAPDHEKYISVGSFHLLSVIFYTEYRDRDWDPKTKIISQFFLTFFCVFFSFFSFQKFKKSIFF